MKASGWWRCSTITSTSESTLRCPTTSAISTRTTARNARRAQDRITNFSTSRAPGHYVGTVMSVVQTQVSWFGEGDDLFYVDGATKPQIHGTGTEDYFNEAWGLRDVDRPVDRHAGRGRREAGRAADRLSLARSRSDSVYEIALGGHRALRLDLQCRRNGALRLRRAPRLLFERRVLVPEGRE